MGSLCDKCKKSISYQESDPGGDNESGSIPNRGSKKEKPSPNNICEAACSYRQEACCEFKYSTRTSTTGLVINCYESNTRRTVPIPAQIRDAERRKSVFKCRYTSGSNANHVRTRRHSIPAGNFVDCRDIPARNYIYVIKEWLKWSHSVCQIRFPHGTATGFRVGSKYVMTAYHVVRTIVEVVPSREFVRHGQIHVTALEHRNVFCLFEYLKEEVFEHERKYFFKTVIHFKDECTDVAVLELADNGDGQSMPLPFEFFSVQNVTSQFTLIGHNGSAMEYNEVDLVIDREASRTLDDIRLVKNHSLEQTNENFECPPYNILTNKQRVLFHCKFSKGASGTPGIVVLEDGSATVVTMLLCGYPNWYYDGSVDRNLQSRWPKEYCIEQGADMASVARTIGHKNPYLYQDIFCRHLPEPYLQRRYIK